MRSRMELDHDNHTENDYEDDEDWAQLKHGYYFFCSVMLVFGTLFNAWALGALLTSPEMRVKMRNKLICLMLFNNLLKTTFLTLFEVIEYSIAEDRDIYVDCTLGSFLLVVRFSLMWVENWYVLIFLVHYTLALLEFNVPKYLSPRTLQIGTILILLGPWVISFIVGPAMLAHESHIEHGVHSRGCIEDTDFSIDNLANFGIVAPWFLKWGLLALIVTLNYQRRTRYSTTDTSLVSTPTFIDDVKAYILLCLIVLLTQTMLVVEYMWDIHPSEKFLIIYEKVAMASAEIRAVFIPFSFLCLEDIKMRVKAWRPWDWHTSASGSTNMTRMHYENNTHDL